MKKKSKTTVEIKPELKQDLREFAKNVSIGAAAYARDYLTNAAYAAFERFYCDYTPENYGLGTNYKWKFWRPSGTPQFYSRTYNVLLNTIDKFYENKHHGKIVRGGVCINPDNMKENYDHISPSTIFTWIYEEGKHGIDLIPKMNPTPEELIERYKSTLVYDTKMFQVMGERRAKGFHYDYLTW